MAFTRITSAFNECSRAVSRLVFITTRRLTKFGCLRFWTCVAIHYGFALSLPKDDEYSHFHSLRFRHLRPGRQFHACERTRHEAHARARLPEAWRAISAHQVAASLRQEPGAHVH